MCLRLMLPNNVNAFPKGLHMFYRDASYGESLWGDCASRCFDSACAFILDKISIPEREEMVI